MYEFVYIVIMCCVPVHWSVHTHSHYLMTIVVLAVMERSSKYEVTELMLLYMYCKKYKLQNKAHSNTYVVLENKCNHN